MNKKWISIFWGIVLILTGIWALANSLGYIEQPPAAIWIAVFGGLSLFFFISYFISGLNQWGWLFPATITAALALTIYLADIGLADESIASLIMGSVMIPFLAAYFVDRQRNWWALIPAWVLLVVIGIIEIANNSAGEFIASLVMYAIALPFLVVYLTDRNRQWALLPFFILVVIGTIPLLAIKTAGEWVAMFVMFAIAVPFLAIFLKDRTNKWALIPAFALAVIGLIPPLTRGVSEEWIGAFVMLMIGLPFLVVYFLLPAAWWALIPAGIMSSIAVGVGLVALLGESNDVTGRIVAGVMFLGWGLTFGLLWLRRNQIQTDWAKYPALGLGIFGLAIMIFGQRMNDFWPVFVIATGLFMLYSSWRSRRTA